jgi:hypothetical protein
MALFQSPPPSLPAFPPRLLEPLLTEKAQLYCCQVKFPVCPVEWFLHMGCSYVESIKLSASGLFMKLLSSHSH